MTRVKAPEERKTIAHGASRGKNGDFVKPRHGAKGRVPPSFAPPGLPCVRFVPTARAVGYWLSPERRDKPA